MKNPNEADASRISGLFLGSEPLQDVHHRSAKKDGDKGDDDTTDTKDSDKADSDAVDTDQTDKGDGGEDTGDTDGKD